ncbi:hypothetical protein AB1N83_013479 [Pleurotus pulmonarius]
MSSSLRLRLGTPGIDIRRARSTSYCALDDPNSGAGSIHCSDPFLRSSITSSLVNSLLAAFPASLELSSDIGLLEITG